MDNMTTYGDWFTGFGGMTLGAIAAGLDVVFGAEYDPKIADVYRQNIGDHIRVCNLLEIDVSEFPRVDVFHASPPCPNFSNAKTNGVETENDIALSAKVAEYITYHLPDIFTLENVYQYRNSKSWQVIAQTLLTHGYLFNYWHVNMADYGVPQTRQRMIAIARRDGVMPQLPPATHTAEPQPGLFGTMKRWVSWYEAIEDLYEEKTLTKLPAWAIAIKPSELGRFALMPNSTGLERAYEGRGYLDPTMPAATVTSKSADKVFLCDGGRDYRPTLDHFLRWQTFPDKYATSKTRNSGVYGIGNAVPPLFAEKLCRHLVPGIVTPVKPTQEQLL